MAEAKDSCWAEICCVRMLQAMIAPTIAMLLVAVTIVVATIAKTVVNKP